MSSHTVVFDDSNTDSIHYVNIELGPFRGKGWSTQSGPSLDEETEGPVHNSTLHVATVEDTSVSFPFNGTRVSVFGSIWPPTATFAPLTLSQYSVLGWDYGDEPSMRPFQAPNLTTPKNNINFFTSNDMPFGFYVLTINVTSASENMPYYLDYITVEVPGTAPSTSPISSSMTSQPTSMSPPPLSTRSNAAGATVLPPLPGFVSNNAPTLPIGAIVGAAIGGVLIVAITVAIIVCARRHRSRSFEFDFASAGQQDLPPVVTPYSSPPSHGGMVQHTRQVSASTSDATPYTPSGSPTTFVHSRKVLSAMYDRPLSDATDSSASASNVISPSPLGPHVGTVTSPNPDHQHQARTAEGEESPPAYTPATAHEETAVVL